ncbi:MAG: hypothetical protein QOJ89_3803 [bacterium]
MGRGRKRCAQSQRLRAAATSVSSIETLRQLTLIAVRRELRFGRAGCVYQARPPSPTCHRRSRTRRTSNATAAAQDIDGVQLTAVAHAEQQPALARRVRPLSPLQKRAKRRHTAASRDQHDRRRGIVRQREARRPADGQAHMTPVLARDEVERGRAVKLAWSWRTGGSHRPSPRRVQADRLVTACAQCAQRPLDELGVLCGEDRQRSPATGRSRSPAVPSVTWQTRAPSPAGSALRMATRCTDAGASRTARRATLRVRCRSTARGVADVPLEPPIVTLRRA